MVVLRCTGRVLSQIKSPPAAAPSPSQNRLGDWYVNILYLRPTRLLLCVSEKTLLPVLIPAKDLSSFPERLAPALREVLLRLGIAEAAVEKEIAAMSEVTFAKTASRQIVGTINDFTRMLEAGYLDGRPHVDISLHLAEAPCGPIDMESPDRATCELFSSGG